MAVMLIVIVVVGSAVAVVALISNHRAEVAAKEQAEKESASAASASSASVAASESAEAEASASAQAAFRDCRRQISPLINALNEVDARLNVGLNQKELSDLVGTASVAYSEIDVRSLGKGPCLYAAAKLETALNAYSETVSKWNDCIFDYYCDMDSIDPELQSNWSKAGRLIDRAQALLDQLDPTSPDYAGTSGNGHAA